MADEVKNKLNENYTEFNSNPKEGFWFYPTGLLGRFFTKFFGTVAIPQAQKEINKQGDVVVTKKVIRPGQLVPPELMSIGILKNPYPIIPETEQNRKRRYLEYDEMDGYPEITSAFDIYADDCTQKDLRNKRWKVKHDDQVVVNELDFLFERLRLDTFYWDIVRNTVKYGDCFVELLVDLDFPKQGIYQIKILNPKYILRVENEYGVLTDFLQEVPDEGELSNQYGNMYGMGQQEPKYIKLDKAQIVHFRLHTSDPAFYPYGKSIAAGCRETFKSLKMMEDAMLIYRLCLTGDTKIRLHDGSFKYMNTIRAGDKVQSYDPITKKTINSTVTHFTSNGIKKVYEVKSLHHSIKATDTHPILVKNKKTGIVGYVDVKDLQLGLHQFINVPHTKEDIPVKIPRFFTNKWAKLSKSGIHYFKQLPITNKTQKMREVGNVDRVRQFLYTEGKALSYETAVSICEAFNIPNNYLVEQNKGEINPERITVPDYMTEDFARLFGFMLGDGTVRQNSISFTAGTNIEITNKYTKLLEQYFGKTHFSKEKRSTHPEVGTVTISSATASKIFKALGFISGPHNKRIPQWAFSAPRGIRKALIEGIIDADGWDKKLRTGIAAYEIQLCNKGLIEDIRQIWIGLGYCAGHIKSRKARNGGTINGRQITSNISWTLYLSEHQLKPFEDINSVTFVNEQEVFDITVDNPLHNFIAENVPVHNTRAPERRVFYIDTGQLPVHKADQVIQNLIQKFKKEKHASFNSPQISSRLNPPSPDEDIFLPVKGNSNTRIEVLPGAQNLGDVDDVKYFRDKLLATLKVPKDYVVEKDKSPERKANLSQLDAKFARTINRIQRHIEIGLEQIAKRHLQIKGFPEHVISKVRIELPDGSDISIKRKLDIDQLKAMVVQAVIQLNLFSRKQIYKEYYDMTDAEIERMENELEQDMEAQAMLQSQYGAPMGGGVPMGEQGAPGEGGPDLNQPEGMENVQPTDNSKKPPLPSNESLNTIKSTVSHLIKEGKTKEAAYVLQGFLKRKKSNKT